MKILAVADEEAPRFYDYYTPGALAEFDLILACGDLHKSYLEFLVTMARCPVLYVHGNHDASFDLQPPEGCQCIEDEIFCYRGVRILGLGGSHRYREGPYLYTQQQMQRRVKRLWYPLWRNKGFDILLTHAPAYQINDFDSPCHQGFEAFRDLLDKYQPRYFVHGHIHKNYGIKIPQVTPYGDTTIINACGYAIFEIDEPEQ
ncbi:MAG: metallophosphoesterase [Clostridiales bacterium]|nr:metallophosphoesterase [Clostridiales bacterium]